MSTVTAGWLMQTSDCKEFLTRGRDVTKYPVGKNLSSWEAFVSGTDPVGGYIQQTILPVKSYGRGWFYFHQGDPSA